jgi:DNA anti-recombination protein RmuC
VPDPVWPALSSPGGTGHFVEIGLVNTLKSFGLMIECDFILKAAPHDGESQRKRPDALVFRPAKGGAADALR